VVAAYSHERSEEADRPKGHEHNPSYDNIDTKLWGVEDLQVEEWHGCLDEPDSENAGHDESVVVLANA
jgi:hypothetical protein